jgi:hypothetical protein
MRVAPVFFIGAAIGSEKAHSTMTYAQDLVPRGGLSLRLFNRSKINYLTPPQMPALYQANVPMSIAEFVFPNTLPT